MANVPILGRQARADDIHDFKKRKMELKEQGYPVQGSHQLVKDYIEKVKDKFEGNIDKNTVLVCVPSGSGKNMLTLYFAQALEQLYGCKTVPTGMISKLHTLEAKNALSLDKRNVDPIGYKVKSASIKKYIPSDKKVVIVDDVIGTGESAIKLKSALEREHIKVNALANMITIENRYPTMGDMDRLLRKIDEKTKLNSEQKLTLSAEIEDAFAGYTRQKINRLERGLVSDKAVLQSIDTISEAASIERKATKLSGVPSHGRTLENSHKIAY